MTESPALPRPAGSETPTSSAAAVSADATPPPADDRTTDKGADLVLQEAEAGLARFCEQAFVDPETARASSQALVAAFEDRGLWLASLVQPVHLLAELRQACSVLTRFMVAQWMRQGETAKLADLGDALVGAQPPVTSQESGQMLALLAGLLGLLCPGKAPAWLDAARPRLKDSEDEALLNEARQWVAVGQLLAPLPVEDRAFWSRHLREPRANLDWNLPESREALRRLAPLLPAEHAGLAVIQAVVPACWWDLLRRPAPVVPLPAAAVGGLRSFALGMLTGLAAMTLAAGWLLSRPAPVREVVREVSVPIPVPPVAAVVPAVKLAAVTKPQSATRPTEKTEPQVAKPQPVAPPPAPVRPPQPVAAVLRPASPGTDPERLRLRREEASRMAAAHPGAERLHRLVRTASLREAEPHLQGRSTVATYGSPTHRALLRWLLLDPPEDPTVRRLAAKLAVRLLPVAELCRCLELSLYPGSPNETEARECASLLLDLGAAGMTDGQRELLQGLIHQGAG